MIRFALGIICVLAAVALPANAAEQQLPVRTDCVIPNPTNPQENIPVKTLKRKGVPENSSSGIPPNLPQEKQVAFVCGYFKDVVEAAKDAEGYLNILRLQKELNEIETRDKEWHAQRHVTDWSCKLTDVLYSSKLLVSELKQEYYVGVCEYTIVPPAPNESALEVVRFYLLYRYCDTRTPRNECKVENVLSKCEIDNTIRFSGDLGKSLKIDEFYSSLRPFTFAVLVDFDSLPFCISQN